MAPFILYLLAGIVTGYHVFSLLMWAVWGAPTHPLQYVSLTGSLVLIIAAYISLFKTRLAAKVALVGIAAIWSFYAPAIVTTAQVKLSEQEITLRVYIWTPGPERLNIEDNFEEEEESLKSLRARLEQIGLSGNITRSSYSVYGPGRKRSEVILIMQRQVEGPVRLRQPDGTSVIYVQHDEGWKMYPEDAPTLERFIELEPMERDPKQATVMVEHATGGQSGTGVCCLPDSKSSTGNE